jgi:hypothetical protein
MRGCAGDARDVIGRGQGSTGGLLVVLPGMAGAEGARWSWCAVRRRRLTMDRSRPSFRLARGFPFRVMPAAAASARVSLLIDVRDPGGRRAFCSRLDGNNLKSSQPSTRPPCSRSSAPPCSAARHWQPAQFTRRRQSDKARVITRSAASSARPSRPISTSPRWSLRRPAGARVPAWAPRMLLSPPPWSPPLPAGTVLKGQLVVAAMEPPSTDGNTPGPLGQHPHGHVAAMKPTLDRREHASTTIRDKSTTERARRSGARRWAAGALTALTTSSARACCRNGARLRSAATLVTAPTTRRCAIVLQWSLPAIGGKHEQLV